MKLDDFNHEFPVPPTQAYIHGTGQGHALLELISTGYGTVTGELHPPPRQGNARLTSSTAARLNIIDRPVYTFTNIRHP
jgi:hypothetical protein